MTVVYQHDPPTGSRRLVLAATSLTLALFLLWGVSEQRLPGSSEVLRLPEACNASQAGGSSLLARSGLAWQLAPCPNPQPCQVDPESIWNIGLFSGPSPLNLTPYQAPNPARRPGSSPVEGTKSLACASVNDPSSISVASPFLWTAINGSWYLFFEARAGLGSQGDIGVAESRDLGATWKYLGIVLDETWHLGYPFLFSFGGEIYMLPEAADSGGLRLYRAAAFPLQWEPAVVLLNGSFSSTAVREWGERWWMFTTPAGKQQLHIYYADTPLGPWLPHALNPVLDNARGAWGAGRLVYSDAKLLRFGHDCNPREGGGVAAYQILKLTPSKFEQIEIPFSVMQPKPGIAAWIGSQHCHVDATQMSDGTWLVAMAGDKTRQ